MIHFFWLLPFFWVPLAPDQDSGKIMRPVDGAALPSGEVSIIASAPGGKLLLDGQMIPADQPFPDVLHAKTVPASGQHKLALVWENNKQEITFFVGDNAPPEFKAFREHPPLAVECTQCHGLSRKGRFRFTGNCFSCHQQEVFPKSHHHPPSMLESCGQCHNAHGSTAKAHLVVAREQACGFCHAVLGSVRPQ